MSNHLTKAAVAAAAALSRRLGACSAGSGGSDGTSGENGGDGGAGTEEVVLGFVAEPANLDFTTTDGAAIPQVLLYNVYESLVEGDQAGVIGAALGRWG